MMKNTRCTADRFWRYFGAGLAILVSLMVGADVSAGAGVYLSTYHLSSEVITVTTFIDEYGTGSACSLREAIQAANTQSAFGGCPAGGSTTVINLSAGVYTLARAGAGEDGNATGDLDIHSDIVINGSKTSPTIIDGGGLDRVFQVHSGMVVFNDLTIRNGQASHGEDGSIGASPGANGSAGVRGADGGGIHNLGTLVLNRCTIIDNAAGNGGDGGNGRNGVTGSYGGGRGGDGGNGGLGARGGHGGAIYNEGTLVLNTCVVTGNSSGNGGNGGSGGLGGKGGNGRPQIGAAHGGDGGHGGAGGAGLSGGIGGAIYNLGTLALNASTLSQNTSGDGGDGGHGGAGGDGGTGTDQYNDNPGSDLLQSAGRGGAGGSGGRGGHAVGSGSGGAVGNYGTLTVIDSHLTNNATGLAAGQGGHGGAGGHGGHGGDGLEENPACDGGRAGDGGAGGDAGNGGRGGHGVAIYQVGLVTVTNSTLSHNIAGDGQAGGHGGAGGSAGQPGSGFIVPPCYNGAPGANGDGGQGGRGGNGGSAGVLLQSGVGLLQGAALLNRTDTADVQFTASALYANRTGAGGAGGNGGDSGSRVSATAGRGGDGGAGGAGGNGGAISNAYYAITIDNSTISDNQAGGSGGHGGTGGTGRVANGVAGAGANAGLGGGIYNANSATLTLSGVTIAGNSAQGNGGTGSSDGVAGRGGGIYNAEALSFGHTLLGGNTAAGLGQDCYGSLTSQNYNLIENVGSCTLSGATNFNITGQNPLLGALANNGGPTKTRALLKDSPALDGGAATCYATSGLPLTTDQRGQPRPVDSNDDGVIRCDIGAYEAQSYEAFIYLPLVMRQ